MELLHHSLLAMTVSIGLTTSASGQPETRGNLSQPMIQSSGEQAAVIAAAGFGDVEICAKKRNDNVHYDIELLDLNADGINESLVTARGPNDCFKYGGTRAALMIKDASGQWKPNIKDIYDLVKVLAEGVGGYPDITSSRGHYCRPIWRWNNSQYEIHKICKYGQLVPPSEAGSVSPVQEYDHNGSRMVVDFDKGTIRYAKPKASLAGTVLPKTVLFEGTFTSESSIDDKASVKGTAFIFKKGCDPAPYPVTGFFDGAAISLSGVAPIRAKNSCAIVGTSSKSPHSHLTFYPIGEGDIIEDRKIPGFTMPGSEIQMWSAGVNEVRGAIDHTANVLFFREGTRWRVEADCQVTNTGTGRWTTTKGQGYVSLVGSMLQGDVGPLGRLHVTDHRLSFENKSCAGGVPDFGTGD
jgi:hypothetical protein